MPDHFKKICSAIDQLSLGESDAVRAAYGGHSRHLIYKTGGSKEEEGSSQDMNSMVWVSSVTRRGCFISDNDREQKSEQLVAGQSNSA